MRNAWLLNIMFKFIHFTNEFGYSTTQRFTMLFPSQFFIYDFTIVLVNQSSFHASTVYIYLKGICVNMFFVVNVYFVLYLVRGDFGHTESGTVQILCLCENNN